MGADKAPGWFAVKLEAKDGKVTAVLTGDHFGEAESGVAKAVAAMDSKRSVLDGGSPVYLVRDSAVGLAAYSAKKSVKDVSECRRGAKGGPCGRCAECKRARRDAFTHAILGSIELPCGDLSGRIKESVSSALGLMWLDAPWEGPMSEEDVDKLFDAMRVTRKQEGEQQ